jgi:hypothetical protein
MRAACSLVIHSAAFLQFRAFVDGPRGLMAEALRATQTTLPPELSSAFSYLSQRGQGAASKGSAASRRSRRSAISSVTSSPSQMPSLGRRTSEMHSADAEHVPDTTVSLPRGTEP